MKARIISESLMPGINVAEVARRHDMQPQHLYEWRRRAMERMEARGQSAFVPAMIEAPAIPPIGRDRSDSEIGIAVGGMTLTIPDGASMDHIARVLLAVRALPPS